MDISLQQQIIDNLSACRDKIPCFVYDRVSTLDQAETGLSLANQKTQAEQYCKDQDLCIIHQFTVAESARKEGRRIFNTMIKAARTYNITHLVFKNTDRMSRNYNDLVLIMDLVKNRKFVIHFYEDRKRFDANSNHTEEFVLGINMAMAKYWSDKISFESRSTFLYKAKKGIAPICTPPLGYIYDKDQKKHVIDEATKHQVHYIFDRYDNGTVSIRNLVDELNDQGLKTSRGGQWNKTTLNRMLTSIFYTGAFEYQDQIWQGTHEPYITLERFESRLEKLKIKYKSTRTRTFEFDYSGLLRYKDRLLTGEMHCGAHNSGNYIYYTNRYLKAQFKEEKLSLLIDQALEGFILTYDGAQYLEKLFRDSVEVKDKNQGKEKEKISKLIMKLERENDDLLEKLYEGFDPQTVQRRMQQNRKQIEQLEKQHQKIRVDKEAFIFEVSNTIEKCRKFLHLYQSAGSEERIEALKSMAESISINDEATAASISWKIPYRYILNRDVLRCADIPANAGSNLSRDGWKTGLEPATTGITILGSAN